MNLNDINQTVLSQMDPEVAIALIRAQAATNTWESIASIGVAIGTAVIFWALLKYLG